MIPTSDNSSETILLSMASTLSSEWSLVRSAAANRPGVGQTKVTKNTSSLIDDDDEDYSEPSPNTAFALQRAVSLPLSSLDLLESINSSTPPILPRRRGSFKRSTMQEVLPPPLLQRAKTTPVEALAGKPFLSKSNRLEEVSCTISFCPPRIPYRQDSLSTVNNNGNNMDMPSDMNILPCFKHIRPPAFPSRKISLDGLFDDSDSDQD